MTINLKFFPVVRYPESYHFCVRMLHGGFYRTSDHTWVAIERIQFLGACNPPTDPGRKPLSHRYGVSIN